ncbi:MAG: ACP S-malonyltransferase [Deltaproteobacteria bacterium]|nr:ACP S-malonyltransferase [Deltaproteobacteria bacterium]
MGEDMKIAGVFPGQGSQKIGMGKELFEESGLAKELFKRADNALDFSLSSLCFNGPEETLRLTENTQPALLVVSYIAYKLAEIELSCAAGHSLGEYSALLAADVFDFEDAVTLVHKRGRYMQDAVPPGAGKMVAVMGPTEAQIRGVIAEISSGTVEIANLNSPGQTVIAGDIVGIDTFINLAPSINAKVIPLNVSAPFHCRLMQPAADKLAKDLDKIIFRDPKFPVYSNVSATIIKTGDEARKYLKEQVCSSVRWTDLFVNMCNEQSITHTIEFGPSGVLTKLIKRINENIVRCEISDTQTLAKTKQELI